MRQKNAILFLIPDYISERMSIGLGLGTSYLGYNRGDVNRNSDAIPLQ
jgi:hypothetical protein